MSRKRKRRTPPKRSRNILAAIRRDNRKSIRPIRFFIVLALFMVGWTILRYEPVTSPENADIVVYATSSCSCYRPWVRELRRAGLAVGVVQTRNIMQTQADLDVPREFSACHTAEAGGYWFEGHVPSASITTLLQERPEMVGGLAHLRAKIQTGEKLIWEVVTYDTAGQPISSETPDHRLKEGEAEAQHEP